MLSYQISTISHWVVYYQTKLLFGTINRYYFEKDVKENPHNYLLHKNKLQIIFILGMLTNINLSTLFLLLIFLCLYLILCCFCFLFYTFSGYLFQDTKKYFTHKKNNNKVGQLQTFIINSQPMPSTSPSLIIWSIKLFLHVVSIGNTIYKI